MWRGSDAARQTRVREAGLRTRLYGLMTELRNSVSIRATLGVNHGREQPKTPA